MAIRAILTNPRYTGYQCWNRQRKDEILVNVKDVALGHMTWLRWNTSDKWVRSDKPAHPAIIDLDTFDQVQAKLATRGATTTQVKPRRTPRPELLERFRGRRFIPLDPPDFLDYPGTEIVLIGAAQDAARELNLDLDAEVEKAVRSTIFDDLRIGRQGRPVEPLFAGQWR